MPSQSEQDLREIRNQEGRLREIEVERADLRVSLAQLAAEEIRLMQKVNGHGWRRFVPTERVV